MRPRISGGPMGSSRGSVSGQSGPCRSHPDRLPLQTISVLVNGYHQHLVSYYNPTDVHEDRLFRPRDIQILANLDIGDEYLRSDSFRLPIQTGMSADGKLRYVYVSSCPDMRVEGSHVCLIAGSPAVSRDRQTIRINKTRSHRPRPCQRHPRPLRCASRRYTTCLRKDMPSFRFRRKSCLIRIRTVGRVPEPRMEA